MNPELIKTREDALALVDADLITVQDYFGLCGFKGWNPAPDCDAPVSAQQRTPANWNEQPASAATQRVASRLGTSASRSEPAKPIRTQTLGLSVTSA